MPDPLAGALADKLDRLEKRIEELSRRGTGHGAPIARKQLSGAAGEIVLDHLPQTYRHLEIVCSVAITTSPAQGILIQFNDFTSGSYDVQYMWTGATTVHSDRYNDTNRGEIGAAGPGNRTTSSSRALIVDYTASEPTWITATSAFASEPSRIRTWQGSTCWYGTASHAPVHAIRIFPGSGSQFTTGSTVSVYGLR